MPTTDVRWSIPGYNRLVRINVRGEIAGNVIKTKLFPHYNFTNSYDSTAGYMCQFLLFDFTGKLPMLPKELFPHTQPKTITVIHHTLAFKVGWN